MLKKIIIFIVVLLLIAVGIYFFFFRGSPDTVTEGGESVQVGGFFPVGENTQTDSNGSVGETPLNSDGTPTISNLPRLRKISEAPTSGAGIVRGENNSFLRYIDKATGHIFETPIDTLSVAKISNTTIPKIYESVWLENGSGVIIRYLKEDRETIESFYAELKSPELTGTEDGITPQTLEGTFLEQNIDSIASSPQKTNIFYPSETSTGIVGIESEPDGSRKKELFRSPLKEWQISWPKNDTITLTTKPSHRAQGLLYFFNKTSGRLEKILTAFGLTTLTNPNTTQILYSESSSGFTFTSIYNTTTKTNTSFPLTTLPEKCLWSVTEKDVLYCAVPINPLSGNLPDEWYQGITSFSDDIWQINLTTGETKRLANPEGDARTEIDAVNLFTTDIEDYLFFTNKKDDSLWSVRITDILEN